MARPQNSPILAQLRNAKTLLEQATALQALKNEIVGHVQKKEAWIGFGVLEPIVRTLVSNGSPSKVNGKDAYIQLSPSPLSDEDSVRLQALQLVASFANGGPAFLSPLHAARVVPAILTNISPYKSPPQIVLASLQALVDISTAAELALPTSPLNVQTLADQFFTLSNIESINAILSMTSSNYLYQSQVKLASTLIYRTCREERHQNALVVGGVLDSLAAQLARFAVADGLVVPGANDLAIKDGLGRVFPEPATVGSRIGPLLEATGCIIGDSKYRASRLVYSPTFLAIFPSIRFQSTKDSYASSQQALTAMELIIPSLPTPISKAQSAFPTPDRADSRISSRTSLHKFGASAMWDSPRFHSAGNNTETSNEDIESPLIPWLIHLVRSLKDYDRLMAAAVLAALFKAGLGRKGVREITVGLLVVPILVAMIAKSDKDGLDVSDPSDATAVLILEKGPAVLARLITDIEYLQKAAVDCDAVKVLTKLLKRSYQPLPDTGPPKPWSPHADTGMDVESTSPVAQLGDSGLHPLLAHRTKMRESCLKAIGALSAGKEDYRNALVAEDLVPYVVESLSEFPRKPRSAKDKAANEQPRTGPSAAYGSNPLSVIIAGCHVVRTLARSVSVLRTALVDHAVTMPIFRFLRHPDVNVQIAATATVINLVVEVSPVRELLTEQGVMEILCDHAHSDNPALRLNALWALKHFVDAVGPDLKKACLERLGPGWLVQSICDDSQEASVFAPKAKEAPVDDVDEDMDMQALDEPLRWFHVENGHIQQLDTSQSSRLRQIEDRLTTVRDSELNPSRKARNDDLSIQEQGLDFIRNFIGRPEPGIASEAPYETTEMIDYLFNEIGQDRLFEILSSKLRTRVLHPFSRRDRAVCREARVLHPQAKIVVAVICILVHMAASIPRHRQLVTAQSELLKLLAMQASSRDRGVRSSLCHLIINLTWQEDESEAQACSHRARELKKLGFHTKMDHLKLQDRDLDVRERAKTAAWQIEQATY
ncbi:hypothetical protein C2857_003948 [Epichloe festucae Fl1]|uniref:Armadillo repeat-containing protein 8 n=1 Tax=Epichloe festucae (strain Fl1) TaxID=877507 RepID=A0A7S9KUW9_EPIFF|nr:hypothetical protein C2857_003948 [Epichloe festucae Fl1]